MTKDEALKLAYDVLKNIAENATTPYEDDWCGAEAEEVLPSIKEALAQPAQEPVAEAYALADKVRIELDKKCCPGAYMNVAWEAVVTNYRDLTRASPPAAQPPLPVQPEQYKCTVIDNQHPNGIPLEQWVKPQQRPWVGLTDDEEIADFLGEDFHTMTESEERFFRLGVQAAKEKNT